jgi:tRNA-splicing ligase RtcB
MDVLDHRIPRGPGPGGVWHLPGGVGELEDVLRGGSRHAVERGHGTARDLAHCEDRGAVADADPRQVGTRALQRGLGQVGSLGSGNHFLEIQTVDTVYDQVTAVRFGLAQGRICVMIHCGSRGLGHQVCTDHVRAMLAAMPRYGITVPDPQLACAPVQSPEGRSYLGAMAAAANYGRANRQLLTKATRRAFEITTPTGELDLLYDVSHNLAKLEQHTIGGRDRQLRVHRKGATRALPPHHPDLPAAFAEHGQPVLVPGSMGTASYVLAGTADGGAFHSSCHGAGRVMSRHAALRTTSGRQVRQQLEDAGIAVRCASGRGLAEEVPFAYKDVDEVVATCHHSGLARRVARLHPVGVIKG